MLERIYVEIGNVCNLNCSFCSGTKKPPRQMNVSEFRSICEKIKGHTKYIYLHVMGEPLIHPRLNDILNVANEYDIPVCITTNGVLLKNMGDVIIDNSDIVHKVSISLHSLEGNDRNEFEEYLTGAIDFARSAADKGIYVVFRLWNKDSSEGAGKNSQNSLIEGFLHSRFEDQWSLRPRGYRLSKNIFLEFDGVFTWPSDSKADCIDEGFCHGLSSQIAMLADGTVVPCCLDANGEIELGNIYRDSFESIISSDRARAIRDGFSSGRIVEPLCQKCTFARKFKKRNN